MNVLNRIAVALSFSPIFVFAQVQNPIEALYPLFLYLFDFLSLRWIHPSMYEYAAKSIIFIVSCVLIYQGLRKFTQDKFPKNVSMVIAISFSALGILFLPDNLGLAGGRNVGLLFGLIIFMLPIGSLTYFLFKATYNKVQTPALKHLSLGGIFLIVYFLISNSLLFMGYDPRTDQAGVLGMVALVLTFLLVVGPIYFLMGLLQLLFLDRSSSTVYEGVGNTDLLTRDQERTLQRHIREKREKQQIQKAFHKEILFEKKKRMKLVEGLSKNINDILKDVQKYLNKPDEKIYTQIKKDHAKFAKNFHTTTSSLEKELKNFRQYLRFTSLEELTHQEREILDDEQRLFEAERDAFVKLSQRSHALFDAITQLLNNSYNESAMIAVKDSVLQLRTLIHNLNVIEVEEERRERIVERIDQNTETYTDGAGI